MSIDPEGGHGLTRFALNGPVMGTRWSALFLAPEATNTAPIRAALAASVELVDAQMSTWKSESDLMRLNAAPVGQAVQIPPELMTVLVRGLAIGRASEGAFDIALGDLVKAWGFGPEQSDAATIKASLGKKRLPAHDQLDLDSIAGTASKLAPLSLDLSGIAKGYGVDCLLSVLEGFGIRNALVGLDGEMRAIGLRADGRPWTIAVESPNHEMRAAMSILALEDAAVATSGDYRHWVVVGNRRLSHTMDPQRGGPLDGGAPGGNPASVTVVAASCIDADAWATALMVVGVHKGVALARKHGLNVLFVMREENEMTQIPVGPLFEQQDPVL